MKAAIRSVLVAAVVAGALFVGVTAAGAGEVRWFGGCFHQDGTGGTATTTAGPLTVSFGWATDLQSRTEKFLQYQYVTYSVNGGTPVVTSTGWGPITQGVDGNGNTIYVTRWISPTLITLASGESATITMSLKTTKTVWDTDKIYYKAGTELLANPLFPNVDYTTCTVTAS